MVVARLSGEIDMTNANYIGEELTKAVPNEALGLVIDLSGTRYLDSAAIELLFELARRLGRRRQELRLALPADSPLRRVLVLTEVQNVAPLFDSSKKLTRRGGALRRLVRMRCPVAHDQANRIRNVALVGHRGSGKTSLNEALLFEAGAINRLGSVTEGTTVSDSAPDEKAREMSISSSLASIHWDDRKINLLDTPGEPSFVADTLAALRVCDGAVFVVNARDGSRRSPPSACGSAPRSWAWRG